MADKVARRLHNPTYVAVPKHFKAGYGFRRGPQMGRVATKTLPHEGSPTIQSGGQNRKWPTSWLGGYTTPATGVETALKRGN